MKHVIIGAGAAGIKAAETIRSLQPEAEITIVSTDEHVHSRCMLHKFLSHERSEEALSFIDGDFFAKNKINWIKGKSVVSLDTDARSISLHDGAKLGYDKLLIAAGAESFIPPIGELRTALNVFGLRNLSDAQNIDGLSRQGSNALIIGSGLVGLDAAYALLERGLDVTVIEMADSILPMQLDTVSASAYQRLFEKHGCKFLLGRKAVATCSDTTGKITKLALDDGTTLDCDMIIVAAGVRATLAFLDGSRIATGRGICVDEFMRTSVPDVFAAGDITGLSGIWPNAVAQGETAAFSMCGLEKAYTDQYSLKNTINFFGLATLSLGSQKLEDGDKVFVRECIDRYERIVINNGRVKSVILQGKIDYSGFWQYLVKNRIDISEYENKLFNLSFADFFSVLADGQYAYK